MEKKKQSSWLSNLFRKGEPAEKSEGSKNAVEGKEFRNLLDLLKRIIDNPTRNIKLEIKNYEFSEDQLKEFNMMFENAKPFVKDLSFKLILNTFDEKQMLGLSALSEKSNALEIKFGNLAPQNDQFYSSTYEGFRHGKNITTFSLSYLRTIILPTHAKTLAFGILHFINLRELSLEFNGEVQSMIVQTFTETSKIFPNLTSLSKLTLRILHIFFSDDDLELFGLRFNCLKLDSLSFGFTRLNPRDVDSFLDNLKFQQTLKTFELHLDLFPFGNCLKLAEIFSNVGLLKFSGTVPSWYSDPNNFLILSDAILKRRTLVELRLNSTELSPYNYVHIEHQLKREYSLFLKKMIALTTLIKFYLNFYHTRYESDALGKFQVMLVRRNRLMLTVKGMSNVLHKKSVFRRKEILKEVAEFYI